MCGCGLELEPGGLSSALHHPRKAGRGERRAALRGEHEGRLRFLLALQLAQRPQLVAADGMRGWRALLDPADMQGGGGEVHLVPTQVDQLAHPQAMAVRIAMTPAVGLRGLTSFPTSASVRYSRVRRSAFLGRRGVTVRFCLAT